MAMRRELSNIYALEEACFTQYRDAMRASGKEQKIITDSEWHRNHTRNRDDALKSFDSNSTIFREKSVAEAKQSLIKRINNENAELKRMNEIREATEAAKESLRQSKAVTDESKKTLTNLYAIREKQNKKVKENEAKIEDLNLQHSTAQEQYSNITKEIGSVEDCMAKMTLQKQMQENELDDLLRQSQANAQKLNELEQILNKKKKKKQK